MYILAIETTGPFGSVSITNENGEVLAYQVTTEEMSHMKNLIPMTRNAIAQAGLEKKNLTHIACSIGPGSFTGVRVGVSTARALSQVLNIPAVPVGTLEAFTEKLFGTRYISAILNARRGQVYGMIYDSVEKRFILEPSACMLVDVLNAIRDNGISHDVSYFGDGIDAYFEGKMKGPFKLSDEDRELAENGVFAQEEDRYQDAASVGKIAAMGLAAMDAAASAEKLAISGLAASGPAASAENDIAPSLAASGSAAGQALIGIREVNFSELLPDYMRQAEAERKLEAGELVIKSMTND